MAQISKHMFKISIFSEKKILPKERRKGCAKNKFTIDKKGERDEKNKLLISSSHNIVQKNSNEWDDLRWYTKSLF